MHRLTSRSTFSAIRRFSTHCLYHEEATKSATSTKPNEDDDIEAIHTKIRSLDYSCRSLLADIQNVTRTAREECLTNKTSAREAFMLDIKSIDDQLLIT